MKLTLMIGLLLLMLMPGCVAVSPPNFDSFCEADPHSILIVPPLNNVTDVEATNSVLVTLPYFLGEKGFYVFPVNTVKMLLEHEGYYEAAEVHNVPPEQLTNLFNADAVLYVTIHEWTSQYIVIATKTIVDFEYKIYGSDGTLLWQERQKLSYTPNSNSGNIVGLVANIIASAIERGSPNYLPLTRQVHTLALHGFNEWMRMRGELVTDLPAGQEEGIPPGPYKPTHEAYYSRLSLQE